MFLFPEFANVFSQPDGCEHTTLQTFMPDLTVRLKAQTPQQQMGVSMSGEESDD